MASNFLPEHRPIDFRRGEKGFSLLELIIVLAIIMVVVAFAYPNIQTSIRTYRLGGAVSNVTRMVQMARYAAIRQGTNACTLSVGGATYGVDTNCNGAVDPGENSFAVIPPGVTMTNLGPAPVGMPFPVAPVPLAAPFGITFTPRGTMVTPPLANIMYFTGWGLTYAVTVTSAGRARGWRFDGTNWQ